MPSGLIPSRAISSISSQNQARKFANLCGDRGGGDQQIRSLFICGVRWKQRPARRASGRRQWSVPVSVVR